MSTSGSEDDQDGPGPAHGHRRRRNKRKIVMRIEYADSSSEEMEIDDSSSDRKKHNTAQSATSTSPTPVPSCSKAAMDELSDHSVWQEDWLSDGGGGGATLTEAPSNNNNSLGGDGDLSDSSTSSNPREKCPICLFPFTNQEVGKPGSCDHKFCAICIEEWSKQVSTCPIDRKEFLKIVCLESFLNPVVTREISVEVTNKCEDIIPDDHEVTFCRICNRADREDSMLLCDGCNLGYHMECLVPALEQVPDAFWYCDDCFASNEDDDPDDELALQDEIAELMDEVREYGIPETRLRIRTEEPRISPRILRTRQSERIRAAILARTNRRTFRDATREVDVEDMVAMPGPSRMHTSVRIVRETTRSVNPMARRAASRARPRRRVNRKTVVVEYDVDQDDDKFAVKTKKIYRKIKRRRRKKRKETRRTCTRSSGGTSDLTGAEFSNQFSQTNRLELCNDATKDHLTLTRSRAGIPKLSITGNRNDVEYFSSDGEEGNDFYGGSGGGRSNGGGGGLMMATRNRSAIGSDLRTLRNRKAGLMIPDSAMSTTVDVLGSIINEQERWMTISDPRNISKIKIQPDGRLEFDGDMKEAKREISGRSKLPVRNAAAATTGSPAEIPSSSRINSSSSSASNNTSQSSSNAAAGSSSTNNSNGTASNSNSSGTASGSNGNTGSSGSVSSYPDIRTAAARKAPPAADLKVLGDENKSTTDGGKRDMDDSSDENCPNFSVYSAETMQLAKNINETDDHQESPPPDEHPEEREEDLVQLDDDEDMEPEQTAKEKSDGGGKEKTPEKKGENEAGKSGNSAAKSNKKCELELHDDSDWDEWNNDGKEQEGEPGDEVVKIDNSAEDNKDVTDQLNTESISEDDEEVEPVINDISRRSLTPCLDEKHPDTEVEMDHANGDNVEEKKRIEGLELISDDEMGEQNTSSGRNPVNDSKSSEKKATEHQEKNAEGDEFKRLSKSTKERNYRDTKDKDRDRRERDRTVSPKRARSPKHKKRTNQSPSRSSRNRRKDMERYDVRNIIADRKQRPDKYGRDTTKQTKRSRSKSPRSSSLSSLSLDESRGSRSRSRSRSRRHRSRSRSPRRNRRRLSRSPLPARRGRSPPRNRSSRSPINRKRRSMSRFTMSPSMSRSPSPGLGAGRSPRRLARRESPSGNKKLQVSPSRFKNGRSERKKDNHSPVSKRRRPSPEAHTKGATAAVAPALRRRSRSSSAHSSPVKQQKVKARYVEPEPIKSWTPPLRRDDRIAEATASNFKVVVKNSGASKKEKREKKKKKVEKKRELLERTEKERKKDKKKKVGSKSTTSAHPQPSKEVFASGDNILVSVNFSKRTAENPPPTQTTIVTLPPSKDQIITQKKRQEQRQLQREKAAAEGRTSSSTKGGKVSKRKGSPNSRGTTLVVTKNRRHRKVDAKPVAIIDLDGSPFRVLTPSPKAVIVLSDSDGEGVREGERQSKRKSKGSGSGAAVEEGGKNNPQSSKSDGQATKRNSGSSGEPLRLAISDDEDDIEINESNQSVNMNSGSNINNNNNSTTIDASGPKTPPEPALKFSMAMRSKSNVIRAANPLHDAREEEEEDEEGAVAEQPARTTGVIPGASAEKEQITNNSNQLNSSTGSGAADPIVMDSGTTTTTINSQQPINNETRDSSSIPNNSNNSAPPITVSNNNNATTGGGGRMDKIGPNTPPEPAPTSPDAYDPFEPTKSNSVSPVQDMDQSGSNDNVKVVNSPRHKDLRSLNEHKGKIPVKDLVMKLLNSTAGHHHHHQQQSHHHHHGDSGMVGSLSPPPPPPPYLEKSLERSSEGNSKGITILSNVVIQAGKSMDQTPSSTGMSMKHTAAYSTMNSTTTSYSIMKQMQTEAKRMLYSKQKSAAPIVTTATVTTCTPTLTQAMLKKHNAECTLMDIAAESPYSPGSSDFDDLFEPPMEASAAGASNRLPSMPAPSPMKAGGASSAAKNNQAELFDNLFGSRSPPQKTSWTPSKSRKQPGRGHGSAQKRSSQGRRHTSMEDDVPNSAVEMLLKENYIKKLNRQERVVEEVKHVLKPHFHRKLITKEDYKEIMKKSVPKICNSRSGEINPQKIKALIDAYVQKYRYKRKYGSNSGGAAASSTTTATSNTSAAVATTSTNQNKNSGNASTSTAGKSMWT